MAGKLNFIWENLQFTTIHLPITHFWWIAISVKMHKVLWIFLVLNYLCQLMKPWNWVRQKKVLVKEKYSMIGGCSQPTVMRWMCVYVGNWKNVEEEGGGEFVPVVLLCAFLPRQLIYSYSVFIVCGKSSFCEGGRRVGRQASLFQSCYYLEVG